MMMTYSEFSRCLKKIETYQNPRPAYIPEAQDIERLAQLTKTIRKTENSDMYNKKTGRISEYETKQVFIATSKIGEPIITEKDFFAYLIYLSETAVPDVSDPDGAAKVSYLNKYLRENLVID